MPKLYDSKVRVTRHSQSVVSVFSNKILSSHFEKSLNQKITFPTLHSGIGSFAELLQRFHFI